MIGDDDYQAAVRLIGYAPTPENAPDILRGDLDRCESVSLTMFVRGGPRFEDLVAESTGFALCPGCAGAAIRVNFAGGLFLLFDPVPTGTGHGPVLIHHACARPRAGRGGGASDG